MNRIWYSVPLHKKALAFVIWTLIVCNMNVNSTTKPSQAKYQHEGCIEMCMRLYIGWSFNSGTDFFWGSYNTQWSGNSVEVYLHNQKPVSPCIRSLEASKWTYTCSVHCISRWRKFSSMCASVSVCVWGQLVLKPTKCCKQPSESPA
jgi:hypothetical protein